MNRQDIKILLTEEQISERINEIAHELNEQFKDKNPLVIGILNGSFMFFSDLVKKMSVDLEVGFMNASSYNNSTVSGEDVIINETALDIESIRNRDILIIEDIVDTGNTLKKLDEFFRELGTKSVTTVSLLDKPSRRKVNYNPDLSGFVIEDKFVVGYGLDYAQKYRNLPFIGFIEEDVIN